MAIFVSTKRDFRVLVDSGGEQVVGGTLKKTPVVWVNFAPEGQVEITDPELIRKLKHMSSYGKGFTMIGKKEPKIEKPEEELFGEELSS